MNKEELINYLKENLKIEIITDDDRYVEVSLYLDGECISYSNDYVVL